MRLKQERKRDGTGNEMSRLEERKEGGKQETRRGRGRGTGLNQRRLTLVFIPLLMSLPAQLSSDSG